MEIAAHPALDRALREALARGPLPFSRFMELALYHPEGGYYAQERPRIGREGDFATSPHHSPWFGRMVARQLAALWEAMGRPGRFSVREYGPGEGWLARDILEALETAGPAPLAGALDYALVERSTAAAGRLAGRLARWVEDRAGRPCARVETPPGGGFAVPPAFEGAVLAHEFLDALPTHLLTRDEEGLRERFVALEGDDLAFRDGPPSDPLLAGRLEALGLDLRPGQVAEVCLAAGEWMEAVGARLRRGGILIFDYGFSGSVLYGGDRPEGTLRGYRWHTLTADVLRGAGATDLTAHVDFTSLLRAAEAEGLTLAGFTDQCHFLLGLGLAEALEGGAGDPERLRRERMAAMALVNPTGLGSAIKVMLLTRGLEGAAFPAFSMKPDDRASLASLRG